MLILFIYINYSIAYGRFQQQLQSQAAGIDTVEPTKPKILTTCTYTWKVCQTQSNIIAIHKSNIFWAVLCAKKLKFRRDKKNSQQPVPQATNMGDDTVRWHKGSTWLNRQTAPSKIPVWKFSFNVNVKTSFFLREDFFLVDWQNYIMEAILFCILLNKSQRQNLLYTHRNDAPSAPHSPKLMWITNSNFY